MHAYISRSCAVSEVSDVSHNTREGASVSKFHVLSTRHPSVFLVVLAHCSMFLEREKLQYLAMYTYMWY